MTIIRHGQRWGDWSLDAPQTGQPHLVSEIDGRERYAIGLYGIVGSAAMLDWIMQLRPKTWVTNDIIGDLVSAFDDIFDPQGTLCGTGVDHELNAENFLRNRISRAA